MQLALALLLCGTTYCLAQTSCSDNDLLQCLDSMGEEKTLTDPETEEDLERYCRVVECIMKYYNECGTEEDKPMFNQHEIIYGSLCFKKNSLRKKYLDNAKCLKKAMRVIGEKCTINTTGIDHETFCKELPEALTCGLNYVNQTCNEDAADVYRRVYPDEWFYNCHEENKDVTTECRTKHKCSKKDLMQCMNEERIVTDPETEEDLEKYCRAIECILECYGKCRDKENELMYNQHEIIYGSLCFTKNSLRRKYLENAKCLNKAIKEIGEKCPINTTGVNHNTFCKTVPEVLKCSSDYIGEACNEDAAEVYRRVYPGLGFFGCD